MSSHEPYDDLEAELLALGDLLDVPSPPPADVAAAVRARLTSDPEAPGTETTATETSDTEATDVEAPERDVPEPAGGEGPDPAHGPVVGPVRPHTRVPRRRDAGRRPPARSRRRRWLVVSAVVAVVVAITAATPQGRAAVAQILRFAGIELRIGDTPPPPVTTTAPLPGERTVPLAEVPGQVRFQVRTLKEPGPPERVTVADSGRVVSMFWPGGIRFDQFDGALDPIFFKKLGPPWPDYVKVGAYNAWWLPGDHPLGYIKRQDGTEVPLRQAAPTLIWEQGTLNYRLEGLRTKEEAIQVATSLQ
ncbi:hypothetical protein [Nonomuraea sp. NPDC050643]|uniref:hypothetical protein n=1 Tax=Nonomuraea sp. NPDC050643 TaxID=3155660 RepID=UPI0033F55E9A